VRQDAEASAKSAHQGAVTEWVRQGVGTESARQGSEKCPNLARQGVGVPQGGQGLLFERGAVIDVL
jgi:hypothetical protein